MSMSMEQLSEKMPATVEQLERVLQTVREQRKSVYLYSNYNCFLFF